MTRVHLERRGEGAPLVLLHGFTGSSGAWGEPLLETLARRRTVIAIDLPGHGLSPAPATPEAGRIECVVTDLAHLLDDLGLARADWVGYSMGGRVALAMAILRPGRVERLVLESASPGLMGPAEREARRRSDEALARRIERDGMASFVDAWLAQPLFATQARLPPEVRQRERTRRLAQSPSGLAASLRGLGTGSQPSFWERLPEVRVPVLLLSGSEDAKFTDVAERMRPSFERALHVTVPGAGHAVHLEAPDAWLAAVTTFLEDA